MSGLDCHQCELAWSVTFPMKVHHNSCCLQSFKNTHPSWQETTQLGLGKGFVLAWCTWTCVTCVLYWVTGTNESTLTTRFTHWCEKQNSVLLIHLWLFPFFYCTWFLITTTADYIFDAYRFAGEGGGFSLRAASTTRTFFSLFLLSWYPLDTVPTVTITSSNRQGAAGCTCHACPSAALRSLE